MITKPDCWSWPVTDEDRAHGSLHLWQAGRCAICGETGQLFRDHDHETGMVCGLICRSCNGAEWSGARVFDRYRRWSPAKMLDVWTRYDSPYFGVDRGQWAGVKLQGPVAVAANGVVQFEAPTAWRVTSIRKQAVADAAAYMGPLIGLLDDATCNLVVEWLSSGRRSTDTTRRGYVADLAKIAKWAAYRFDVHPVPLLTVMNFAAVSAWSTYYTDTQGMSVRTHRRALGVLSSLFTYAARRGWPVLNPVSPDDHAREIDRSTNKRPVRTLTGDEIEQLRAACVTAEERLVFALLYWHGMRESEVTTACAEHVDWDTFVIRVQKRNGRWIEVPLVAETQELLKEHLNGRGEGALLLDEQEQPRDRFHLNNLVRRLARRGAVNDPGRVTSGALRAASPVAA